MIDQQVRYLLYLHDFSGKGNDRYFIYDDKSYAELSSDEVVSEDSLVVTHDYWLITNTLYKKHKRLPSKVMDVVSLGRVLAGRKAKKRGVQDWDVSIAMRCVLGKADLNSYLDIYYRKSKYDPNVYMTFSHSLAQYFEKLWGDAILHKEASRILSLEVPLNHALSYSAARGVRINSNLLREHKGELEDIYYKELKNFAETHKVQYSYPSKEEVKEKLNNSGYSFEDKSIEYILQFCSTPDGYLDDFDNLKKIRKNQLILNSISSKVSRVRPIVDTHGTSTSRIYYRDPSIQNISKRYRDIFIPDTGMTLGYVDYEQFEVGLMAFLSSDTCMLKMYEDSDAYVELASNVFFDLNKRKLAKKIFLSYAYGMSEKNLLNTVDENSGDRREAKKFFGEFGEFESWKDSVVKEFVESGQIYTMNGNRLHRNSEGDLSARERRVAISHVVQGTASYVFKHALLATQKLTGVEILLPMHDAILFQYSSPTGGDDVVKVFQKTMGDLLNNKLKAKASKQSFC